MGGGDTVVGQSGTDRMGEHTNIWNALSLFGPNNLPSSALHVLHPLLFLSLTGMLNKLLGKQVDPRTRPSLWPERHFCSFLTSSDAQFQKTPYCRSGLKHIGQYYTFLCIAFVVLFLNTRVYAVHPCCKCKRCVYFDAVLA